MASNRQFRTLNKPVDAVTGGDDWGYGEVARLVRQAEEPANLAKRWARDEQRSVIRRRREALGGLVAVLGVIGAFVVFTASSTFWGGVAFTIICFLIVLSIVLGVMWGQEA